MFSASANVQGKAGAVEGSHHLEDPFIMDSTDALEIITTEMRDELHTPGTTVPAQRLEREARELWTLALHVFCLRNDLLAGVFETNILSSAYAVQMQALKLGGKTTEEEMALARGEVPTLTVDYLPNLAISEFDGSFGVVDLHTRTGIKKMLSAERIHDLHVALQVQVAQRSLMAVVVDYNRPLMIEVAMDSILASDAGSDGPPKKVDKKVFLTVHRIKGSLKDRVMSDYNIKSKGETNPKRLKSLKYEVLEAYADLMITRCRGFSMVQQVASVVVDLKNITRDFERNDPVFNVSGKPIEEGDAPAADAEAKGEEPPAEVSRSDADINDMSKFFAIEGLGYDLWCLPDHHSILAVPKPDRSVGVLHSEEGMILRYRVLISLRTVVRTLKLRATMMFAADKCLAEPEIPVKMVVTEMRKMRKATKLLGTGSDVIELTQHIAERSATVFLQFMFTLTQLRDSMGKMHRDKPRLLVDAAIAARSSEIVPEYSFDTFRSSIVEIDPKAGLRERQLQIMETQLFNTSGMVCRGLHSADRLSAAAARLEALQPTDRASFPQMVGATNKELEKVYGFAKIAAGMQVQKACEASIGAPAGSHRIASPRHALSRDLSLALIGMAVARLMLGRS